MVDINIHRGIIFGGVCENAIAADKKCAEVFEWGIIDRYPSFLSFVFFSFSPYKRTPGGARIRTNVLFGEKTVGVSKSRING